MGGRTGGLEPRNCGARKLKEAAAAAVQLNGERLIRRRRSLWPDLIKIPLSRGTQLVQLS